MRRFFWLSGLCCVMGICLEVGRAGSGWVGVEIRNVQISPKSPQVFEPVEISLDLEGGWSNPFDPSEVYVRAQVVGTGDTYTMVQGFYFQDFERVMEGGREVLRAVGSPDWRLRFAPWNTGAYGIFLYAADRESRTEHPKIGLRVASGSLPSFVEVSRDKKWFSVNRRLFFPVGITVRGLPPTGTFGLEERLRSLVGAGFNSLRLVTAGEGFTLEQERTGVYDLRSAWRIDKAMEMARQLGLRVLLVLEEGSDWTENWEKNPYNRARGGVSESVESFWTNLQARLLYKRKLRYLIGRIGGNPNLLGVEFFEGLIPPDYWLTEMAQEVVGVHPYNALVGTKCPMEDPFSISKFLAFRTLEVEWQEKAVEVGSHLREVLERVPSGGASRERLGPYLVEFRGSAPSEFHQRMGLWVSFLLGASGVILGDKEFGGKSVGVFRGLMTEWDWVLERGSKLDLVSDKGVFVLGRGDAQRGILYGWAQGGEGTVEISGVRDGNYEVVIQDAGSGQERYSGVVRSQRGRLVVGLPSGGSDVIVLYKRK